ncbi:uncharacterized protein LOC143561488 isoform X2 [Bidens hawaiensis]|uniref:uncharacterized protein LOC143561488 isoform X2 n=1 Tax=Bidens hawaiensis TaxID=980011 RepID=UPI00404AF8B4
MQNGAYSNGIKLFGETESHTKESASAVEYLVANSPSDFWSNLVKESETGPEKSHKKLSRRVRKPNQNCIEGENAATTPSFVRLKQRSKRKYLKNVGRKPAACENATPSGISDSIALNPGTNGGQQSQPEQPPPHTLENEAGTNGGQQSQPERPPPHTLGKEAGTNGGQQSQHERPPPHTLGKEAGTNGGQQSQHERPPPHTLGKEVGTNGGQQSQHERPPPHTLGKEVGTDGGQQSQPEQPPPHTLEKVGTNGGQQSQPEQPPPHTLEKEVERIRKERGQLAKSHEEKESKLLAEREKEISEVQKRYGVLIHNSKARSKNEDIILENYQRLVKANKLLAEILAQNLQATPALKGI